MASLSTRLTLCGSSTSTKCAWWLVTAPLTLVAMRQPVRLFWYQLLTFWSPANDHGSRMRRWYHSERISRRVRCASRMAIASS